MAENMVEKKIKVRKEWVVMLYLAGDNNLSEDMAGTLNDLGNLGVEIEDVALLVYYDSAYPQVPSRYQDFTSRLTCIPTGISPDPNIKLIGESNSSDPETLVEFAKWCDERYTSENYALFLSGHSDGFQGMSLFRDDESKSVMGLTELRKGLQDVTRLVDRKLQILGFDGCVMSSLEIAYEFRNVTNIMVSSQGFIPDAGLNYAEMLKRWNDPALTKTPEEFAKAVIEVYSEGQQGFGIGGRSVTLSACRLGEVGEEDDSLVRPIERLEKKINQLSKILYNYLVYEEIFEFTDGTPENEIISTWIKRLILREQLKKALLSSQWYAQTLLFEQAVDIKDFCERLRLECLQAKFYIEYIVGQTDPSQVCDPAVDIPQECGEIINCRIEELCLPFITIVEKCEEIIRVFDEVVILSDDVGSEYQYTTGLSLFFPWSGIGYGISEASYNKTEFCNVGKDKQWNKFLKKYLNQVTMRGFGNVFFDLFLQKKLFTLEISRVLKILKELEGKYNTTYDRRGVDDSTYQRYFSKFKNLPPFRETAEDENDDDEDECQT